MENLAQQIEENFGKIKLQDGQEKVIFGVCAIIDNKTQKVTVNLFTEGSKISIVKAVNSVKDNKEADDFNSVVNYFKNNEK